MNQETQSFDSINSNHWKEKKGSAMQYGYRFLIITSSCARDITHLTDLYPFTALCYLFRYLCSQGEGSTSK